MNQFVTRTRVAGAAVLATVVAITLAACSSSGSGSAGTAAGPSAAASGAPTGGQGAANGATGGRGDFGPAASGEIAQIAGRTLQVQSSSEQTAVTYSDATTFSIEKATTLAAVRVGSCVVVTSTATSSSGQSSGQSSASTTTPLKAATVRISRASGGTCTGGFGGGAGARPSGGNAPGGGTRPSGVPTGARPSGARPSGGAFRGGFADVAFGKVTAVSGSTITVQTAQRRPRSGASASTAVPATTTRTVTVSSATSYTTEAKTTRSAVKVGLCAVVQGKTGTTGAVAATTIALSSKTNGSCTSTAGGFAPRDNGNG